MSSFTSLEAATVIGPGEHSRLLKATAQHTMIVTVEGDATEVTVSLEGSHDGFRWTRVNTYQAAQNGMVINGANGALVTYIRANLLTLTAREPADENDIVIPPKVSASIASADA